MSLLDFTEQLYSNLRTEGNQQILIYFFSVDFIIFLDWKILCTYSQLHVFCELTPLDILEDHKQTPEWLEIKSKQIRALEKRFPDAKQRFARW